MAMVSGRRSTLNPDAPLFVPAAVRQVEDFSPEWWQLVTTSTWYHDYWISQNQGADDLFEADEFGEEVYYAPSDFGGFGKNGEMVRRSSGNKSPRLFVEPTKYAEKPAKWANQRVAAPRNIHQPR
ncbi:hypothetical protein HA466_0102260 [Hirschfeldia incana]|nr:hypothetical protein HA466_0102260 [Hirschfeldia incana]